MIDLVNYRCPQLFVLFKYHLKQAKAQKIEFKLAVEESSNDIERFLTKHQYQFMIESKQQTKTIIVIKEAFHCV